jgi:hypothetical protein
MCAQCDVQPQWATHIQTHYRVASAAERTQLDAWWRRRLEADPALVEQYRRHYTHVEQWARQQR